MVKKCFACSFMGCQWSDEKETFIATTQLGTKKNCSCGCHRAEKEKLIKKLNKIKKKRGEE